MMLLLLFMVFFAIFIPGSAYLLVYHTELGMDILEFRCGMHRCCACDEMIKEYADERQTSDGHFCHEWCEDLLEART